MNPTPVSIYQQISLSQINVSPYQARKDFDEEALQGLEESMRNEGLIEPIVVRQVDGKYELISGERRMRAAKSLGWETIEAKIIQTASEEEAAAKGLIENLQRENLNPIEEAEGLKQLQSINKNWTFEKMGQVIGRDKGYVSRSLSLLGLPEEILEKLRIRNLTRDHGIELLRFNDAKRQKAWAKKASKKDWSAKELRTAIDRYLNPSHSPARSTLPPSAPSLDPLASMWDKLPGYVKDACEIAYVGPLQWQFRMKFQEKTKSGFYPIQDVTDAVKETVKSRMADYFSDLAEICGWTPPTVEAPAKPAPKEDVLAAPANFSANRMSPTEVALFWDDVPGVKQYRVYRRRAEETEWTAFPDLTNEPQFVVTFDRPQKYDYWFTAAPIREKGEGTKAKPMMITAAE